MLEQQALSVEVWEARIDELTTRVMVGGMDGSTIHALLSVGEDAEASGQPDCAELARALAKSLDQALSSVDSEGGDGSATADKLLKDGLTELRRAMRQEQSGEAPAPAAYAPLGDDAELVADFLVEAREHLSQIEGQMLLLEKDPEAMEVIHAVFRAFHTIKGLAGFLGFAVVQAVAHEVETLLDLARNSKLTVDPAIVDVVLDSGDFLLGEISSIDRALSGGPPQAPADNRVLIGRIRRLAVAKDTGSGLTVSKTDSPAKSENVDKPSAPSTQMQPPEAEISYKPEVLVEGVRRTDSGQASCNTDSVPQGKASENGTKPRSDAEPAAQALPTVEVSKAVTDLVVANEEESAWAAMAVVNQPPKSAVVSTSAEHPVAETKTGSSGSPRIVLPPAPSPRGTEPAKTPDAGSVRVETAKLDHLMDMVGEMVIAQSLIRHSPILSAASDSRLVGDLSQLARVTAEVQRATMSMRMVPVGQLFQKIERVIRDLSRKANKQVVLETSGTDTEVDKTVAEELSDPLLHMVRNSVDHGIEVAAERIAAGKDPSAKIRLAAYHQGGQIVIEIADDGRGLNAAKIRRKAEEKEIISPSAQLTEPEIYQLIFAPGFSTAEKITDVSGRGVGMDVVRRNVEKLRGRIETQSALGCGTTFLLKLPLTLAIIDGLVVEVGVHRYIIPLSVVREIYRPLGDSRFTIEGRDEMMIVRDELLPVVRLCSRLGIQGRAELPTDGLLVIVESENKRFCLLVDDLIGKQEVVIKGLGETFEGVWGVSGCAVLGDGRVGLILDTDGIYRGRRR